MVNHATAASQVADHGRVVHRDLKPANIMIGEYGEVLVLGWGLAKLVSAPDGTDSEVDLSAGSGDHSTRVGSIAGTPAYMSPEQARGQSGECGRPPRSTRSAPPSASGRPASTSAPAGW